MYGELKEQVFNFWEADTNRWGDKSPVIVFFHGGGFISGKPFYSKNLRLGQEQGLAVIAAGYRLSSHEDYTVEDSIHDAAEMICYLKENAEHFGIDPHRIAVSGNSAGGTMALSLALRESILGEEKDHSVCCVVAFNAPTLLDPAVFKELVGVTSIEPFWYLWSKLFTVDTQEELESDRVRGIITRNSPELFLTEAATPMYLAYAAPPPESGRHTLSEDLIHILHSATFGVRFQRIAEKVGAESRLSYPGKEDEESQIEFIFRHLEIKI